MASLGSMQFSNFKALIGSAVRFKREKGDDMITSVGKLGEFDDESKSELVRSQQSVPFNITTHSSFPLNAA